MLKGNIESDLEQAGTDFFLLIWYESFIVLGIFCHGGLVSGHISVRFY